MRTDCCNNHNICSSSEANSSSADSPAKVQCAEENTVRNRRIRDRCIEMITPDRPSLIHRLDLADISKWRRSGGTYLEECFVQRPGSAEQNNVFCDSEPCQLKVSIFAPISERSRKTQAVGQVNMPPIPGMSLPESFTSAWRLKAIPQDLKQSKQTPPELQRRQ